MKRTPVNPWPWSLSHGYNQGEVLEGITRQLICAGQTAVDGDGEPGRAPPQHVGMGGDVRKTIAQVTSRQSARLCGKSMPSARDTHTDLA